MRVAFVTLVLAAAGCGGAAPASDVVPDAAPPPDVWVAETMTLVDTGPVDSWFAPDSAALDALMVDSGPPADSAVADSSAPDSAPDTASELDAGPLVTCDPGGPYLQVFGFTAVPEAGSACLASANPNSGFTFDCPAYQGMSGCLTSPELYEASPPMVPSGPHSSLPLGSETPLCSGAQDEYPCCELVAEYVGSWEFRCDCYVPCTQGVTTTQSWTFD